MIKNIIRPPKTPLSGWGRYPVKECYTYPVLSLQDASSILKQRGNLSLLGRGQGRAYGDAALNQDNICVDMRPFNRFLGFDAKRGILHAEAGVTLEQVIEHFVPRGWFLPVTPGTKFPTLGGSVACDVHGKSKHRMAHYIQRLHMLLADGRVVTCSRQERPDLFWATTGGMGLTGLILSVEIKLEPIESSWVNYQGVKAKNLEQIFKLFDESDDWPMTVAWVDCVAQGRRLGRSIMMRGAFARRRDLKTAAQRRSPLHVLHKPKVPVPLDFPSWTLNKASVMAFNTLYYAKHPQTLNTIMDYDSFFYPLDMVLHWNRIYGKPGLLQYQFLIPPEKSFDGVKTLLEAISATGKASFLAVLKKFGPVTNQGLISFPAPGYFLALDFPVGNGEILKHMDRWDELVLKFGGRLYLTKDARMQPETFSAMYPRLREWKTVKAHYDPKNIFESDLSRRLNMTPGAHRARKTKPAPRRG